MPEASLETFEPSAFLSISMDLFSSAAWRLDQPVIRSRGKGLKELMIFRLREIDKTILYRS